MPDVLVPNAHLVGLWLQIFATGVYFVYLPRCMSILWKKRRDGLSLSFPGVCLLMFIIVSIDLITEMVRAYHAFSVSGAKGEVFANPGLFYADAATPASLLKNSITVALAIISDIIIVYRTFIVWNFSLVVIVIPVALLCVDIAFGIWSTWTLSQTRAGDNLILSEVSVRVKYFFIITFCVNMLCASLICFKIWRINQRSMPWSTPDKAVTRVFEVIIESAALYCAHLFALIVSDSIGSNVFFVFLDCLPPVTALVFSLLIVRTQTGASGAQPTTGVQSTNIRFWSTSESQSSTTPAEIDLERVGRRGTYMDGDTDGESVPTRTTRTAVSSYASERGKEPEF